jgi:hypothetical protein
VSITRLENATLLVAILNCDILKTILKRAAHEDKEERREERGKKIKKKQISKEHQIFD